MTESEAGAVVLLAMKLEARLTWTEQANWVRSILLELDLPRGGVAIQLLESPERWQLARDVYDNLERPAEVSSMVNAAIKLAHNCTSPVNPYDAHPFARFMGRLALHVASDFEPLVRRHAPAGHNWPATKTP